MIQQPSCKQSGYSVHFIFTVVVPITLFLLSPLFTSNALYAAVVINELLPKTDPPSQEWVELYNNGTEQVSLDRWTMQNLSGDVKTFMFNASAIIAPHGFLTFSGSQTGISFSIAGDTVRLHDEKNNQIDSQSFPGILGYNTSMGRSADGYGTWAICTFPTYNGPNNCPEPSPTATPTPTSTPTSTPTPMPTLTPQSTEASTPTPTLNPARQTFGSFLPAPTEAQVLGATDYVSPTPTPIPDTTNATLKIDKILAFQILAVVIAWSILAITAYVRGKKRVA